MRSSTTCQRCGCKVVETVEKPLEGEERRVTWACGAQCGWIVGCAITTVPGYVPPVRPTLKMIRPGGRTWPR